jgi:hypothetical protein
MLRVENLAKKAKNSGKIPVLKGIFEEMKLSPKASKLTIKCKNKIPNVSSFR